VHDLLNASQVERFVSNWCVDTLGSRIRKRRLALGFGLRALARDVGISAPYLSEIELGRKTPAVSVLLKISYSLECRIDFLEPSIKEFSIGDFDKFLRMVERECAAMNHEIEKFESMPRAPRKIYGKPKAVLDEMRARLYSLNSAVAIFRKAIGPNCSAAKASIKIPIKPIPDPRPLAPGRRRRSRRGLGECRRLEQAQR